MEYTNVTSLIDLWTGEEQESIRIKNELLDENPWRLTTDIKFMKMIATAEENGKPLGEIVNIFNGIQTSAERPKPVYWFDKDEIVSETEEEIIVDKFEKRYHIEKRILKPFFKPTKADEKGMGTYSLLKTDKHIIFPYNADGSLINVEIMKKEYPGTYQYLQDCYDLLVPKCLNGGKGRDIKNATADTWYQYGRTQALTAFVDTPKLIVRILSKEPMYAYDENDMLIASGGTAGYCAIAKLPGSKYDLRYIQAWLNHPYTEKIFQIMGSDFEGGFTARGTYLLTNVVRPLIGRSSHAHSVFFKYDDWKKNVDQGKAAYLIDFPDVPIEKYSQGQKKYIELGEKNGDNTGYKCKIREKWYRIPSVWVPDAFFLRRNNLYPKFVLNCCNAVSTDTMHRIKFNNDIEPERIVLSYYNSISFAFTEICGRSYGGGVLEILPGEVGNVLVPILDCVPIEKVKEILHQVDEIVRNGENIEKALDLVDNSILGEYLHVNEKTCSMARGIWKKMQHRRLKRG